MTTMSSALIRRDGTASPILLMVVTLRAMGGTADGGTGSARTVLQKAANKLQYVADSTANFAIKYLIDQGIFIEERFDGERRTVIKLHDIPSDYLDAMEIAKFDHTPRPGRSRTKVKTTRAAAAKVVPPKIKDLAAVHNDQVSRFITGMTTASIAGLGRSPAVVLDNPEEIELQRLLTSIARRMILNKLSELEDKLREGGS